MDAKEEDAVVPKEEPLTATVASEEPTEVAEAATQPEAPGIPVNAAAATAAPLPAQPTPTAPESDKATAPAAPAKTVGGAAILAKLRAARAAKAKSTDARLPVTVLFASQTGTAREIAQSIGGHCRESLGLEAKARVAALDEFGLDALTPATVPVLVLVASSTGDGDPPDNGTRFYGQIKKRGRAPDALKGMRCTVLGLGDSNYTQFCRVPRALRSSLLAQGAAEFYPGRDADEVDGLESIVEAWLEGLWPALRAACFPAGAEEDTTPDEQSKKDAAASRDAQPAPLPECRVAVEWIKDPVEADSVLRKEWDPVQPTTPTQDAEAEYSAEDPFFARLSAARWLTAPASGDRKVLHCEFDAVIAELGLDADRVFRVRPAAGAEAAGALLPLVPAPCSVRRAFLEGLDLTSPPRKSLLRLLGEHARDADARATLLRWTSRAGRDEYRREVLEERPALLDLLRRFGSRPPFAALLDALPPLSSRLYSITNYAEQPTKVGLGACIALSIVRSERPSGAVHEGVASTWLERLAAPLVGQESAVAGPLVPVYFQSGGAFHPPTSLEGPLIMIGPGTGVAPFLGFLEERRALRQATTSTNCGPAWLFFGCRHPDHDFLYQSELDSYLADGTLDRLEVAFSRTQAHKIYVQDKIRDLGAEVAELMLRPGAGVFVCGDGMGMAAGVHDALQSVLSARLGDGQGASVLESMAREGRYVRDIWT
ncbi:hypothetical protein QBZ16_003286 [Prototheca wickerhamii]|uniref:Methionine synthase reductase n=1 Tax=Prototheca wickerhamii TaxID=3111 RepID=A0AAD9IIQ2_PROWI|nr:hypothetical protein QBZ16_003286 [Prototheca wickerhamii]